MVNILCIYRFRILISESDSAVLKFSLLLAWRTEIRSSSYFSSYESALAYRGFYLDY